MRIGLDNTRLDRLKRSGSGAPVRPSFIDHHFSARDGLTMDNILIESFTDLVGGSLVLNKFDDASRSELRTDNNSNPYGYFIRDTPNRYTCTGFPVFRNQGFAFVWNPTAITFGGNQSYFEGTGDNDTRCRQFSTGQVVQMRFGGTTSRTLGPVQTGLNWLIAQAEEGQVYDSYYNKRSAPAIQQAYSSAQTGSITLTLGTSNTGGSGAYMWFRELMYFRTPLTAQQITELQDYIFGFYPNAIDNP